ncbi:MAG TPA: chalcone isomerase family protein [Candidatus Binatia bacterium]|nr:chalcone isomerase family protein [Candidatus Binatia bacterium]
MRRVALVVSLLALGVGGPVGDVKKGDTMSFTWCPDAGVEVAARGTVRGTVPGEHFARTLFTI